MSKLSRRDFLKYCAAVSAALGASELFTLEKVSQALEAAGKKPPVLWLEGQDCAGCTISFISIENPTPASLILDKISLRYHETIMAAAGYPADKVMEDMIKEGGYVLVVEGSIPKADNRFCMVGGKPFSETAKIAAKRAALVISAGACASFGGIPKGTPSKGMAVSELFAGKEVTEPFYCPPGKLFINLSTCPVHMDHLVGTIVYYLVTQKAPPLDKLGRPLMYFSRSVHENCRRRSHFDGGRYLTDWNDPEQKEWCLLQKGCKGTETYADCNIRRWNNGFNSCIDCGAPCQGCAEPGFYQAMSPLYSKGPVTERILAKKEAGLIPPKENV
jgi:hydrogenase small subunit